MKHISSFEGNFNNVPEYEFTIEETNAIQIKLMEGYSNPLDWISAYSESFRTLIEQEPMLAQRYYEDPEECVEYIREALKKTLH